jgi:RHS repeat-associated protein
MPPDPIGVSAGLSFQAKLNGNDLHSSIKDMYNGNISHMTTAIGSFMQGGSNASPQAMNYGYDQLYRLDTANAHRDANLISSNEWGTATATGDYAVSISYDANGNIQSLARNADGPQMDDLAYHYKNQQQNNKLDYVDEQNSSYSGSGDLKPGQSTGNYAYDDMGNLVKDEQEEIDEIKWKVSGKVEEVLRHNNSPKPDMHFSYNVNGERLVKQVKGKNSSGDYTVDGFSKTYYIRDAQGNILATYKKRFGLNDDGDRIETLEVGEYMLYGSERVGSFNDTTTLLGREVEASISGGEVTTSNPSVTYEATLNPNRSRHEIGRRQYEIKNHLGNVLATVSDDRIPHDAGTDGNIDFYTPVVKSAQDYYPFGMQMPGRKINTTDHQFGFNSKLKDDEWKGSGNHYTTKFRQYDPRIGRWLSRDPLANQFPHQSPYIGMDNNPAYLVDPYGDSTIVSETDDEKYKVEDVRLD